MTPSKNMQNSFKPFYSKAYFFSFKKTDLSVDLYKVVPQYNKVAHVVAMRTVVIV